MTIKPLQIGELRFPNNLIQGPLAGVSLAPFRDLVWQYAKPAFTYTEMISCKTILHQPKTAQKRFLQKAPGEGPLCFQLSGKDPLELAEAVKLVTEQGADLIDLNCGCPKKKLRSKGAGSRLLTEPNTIYQLITAMKQNTHVPISIKIRVEGASTDRFNQEIAQVVKDAGADFLTVHGRHWNDDYDTPCFYDQIGFFVDALDIPVIGNGDVACVDSLKKMLATGCAGAMVCRAGVGQPWLTAKLIAQMNGDTFVLPTREEILAIYIEHLQGVAELLESEYFAVLNGRKLARYYARNFADRKEFCAEINLCDSIAGIKQVCGTVRRLGIVPSPLMGEG